MSSNPPPSPRIVSPFNPAYFDVNGTPLTIGIADLRYLKLTGGILTGLLTCSSGLTSTSTVTITKTTNQIVLGTTRPLTINSAALAGSARTYTIPDAGSNANFILSALGSTQTISSPLSISNTTASTTPATGSLITAGGFGCSHIQVGSAYTATNPSVAGSIINVPAHTYTCSSSNPTDVNICTINQVTISNATTITNAASLYIGSSPNSTGGGTITNRYSLRCSSRVQFQDPSTATSDTVAAFNVVGGIGITKNIYLGGIYSTSSTDTSGRYFQLGGALTVTTATPTNVNMMTIGAVPISNATAIANATSFYVVGPPTITGGGSITNPFSFQVAAGVSKFSGEVQSGSITRYRNYYSCKLNNGTTAQGLSIAADFVFELANIQYDPSSMATSGTYPFATIKKAGMYLVTVNTSFSYSTTGVVRYTALTLNGVTRIVRQSTPVVVGSPTCIALSYVGSFALNDVIQPVVYQDGVNFITIGGVDDLSTQFSVTYLGESSSF